MILGMIFFFEYYFYMKPAQCCKIQHSRWLQTLLRYLPRFSFKLSMYVCTYVCMNVRN